MDNNKEYKKIDFKQLLENKKITIVSSKEALKDVTPFEWSDEVLSGKKKVIIDDCIELDTNTPSPEEFDNAWFPKCHICSIQVKDTDGEICDECLNNVNKRLYKKNEKMNEVEYNIPYNESEQK